VIAVLPAIDLQGGRQVGLVGGRLDVARGYGDPAAFAARRAAEGFTGLHVVDLDGAAAGRPRQVAALRRIRRAAPGLYLEAGGGVRSVADALALRAAGADRVIVGTAAVAPLAAAADPPAGTFLAALLARLGSDAVAVAVDVRDEGGLAVAAWRDRVAADLAVLGARLAALGVRFVVVTDTGRDGSLGGVRTSALACLAAAGLAVSAGGGAASDDDLAALARAGAWAAVVGRAFHSGGWRPPVRLEPGERVGEGALEA
jgi:phosphoribosylformimino-5-aminoimidazole carboxamide ribotide isomerase